MSRRKLWPVQEDSSLRELVLSASDPPSWERISELMETLGYLKTAKQCKDRWINNLSPVINKSKWTYAESQELFKQKIFNGNKWKNISSVFAGRTDNAVKNQFFSVIRKSLRTMNRMLNINCNTNLINSVRPKVLAELLSASSDNCKRSAIIQKFAFTPYKMLIAEIDEAEMATADEVVKFVISANRDYISMKESKQDNKNDVTSKNSQVDINELGVKAIAVSAMSIEKSNPEVIKAQLPITTETVSQKDLRDECIDGQIKELHYLHNSIRNSSKPESQIFKEKMIEFFTKLANVSSSIRTEIESTNYDSEADELLKYISASSKLIEFSDPSPNSIVNEFGKMSDLNESFDREIIAP